MHLLEECTLVFVTIMSFGGSFLYQRSSTVSLLMVLGTTEMSGNSDESISKHVSTFIRITGHSCCACRQYLLYYQSISWVAEQLAIKFHIRGPIHTKNTVLRIILSNKSSSFPQVPARILKI